MRKGASVNIENAISIPLGYTILKVKDENGVIQTIVIKKMNRDYYVVYYNPDINSMDDCITKVVTDGDTLSINPGTFKVLSVKHVLRKPSEKFLETLNQSIFVSTPTFEEVIDDVSQLKVFSKSLIPVVFNYKSFSQKRISADGRYRDVPTSSFCQETKYYGIDFLVDQLVCIAKKIGIILDNSDNYNQIDLLLPKIIGEDVSLEDYKCFAAALANFTEEIKCCVTGTKKSTADDANKSKVIDTNLFTYERNTIELGGQYNESQHGLCTTEKIVNYYDTIIEGANRFVSRILGEGTEYIKKVS